MADLPRPLADLTDGTQVQRIVTVDVDGNIVVPSGGGGVSDVAVVDPAIAGAPTTVSVLVSNTQLLAANSDRTEAIILNDGSAQIRLEIGNNATLTSAITLEAGESWVTSKTLVINAISTSGTQAASITEYTK